MDNRRFVLLCMLGVLLFMLYNAWQEDYGPKPEDQFANQQQPVIQSPDSLDGPLPTPASVEGDVPSIEAAPTSEPVVAEQKTGTQLTEVTGSGQLVTVNTDVLHVEIDTNGGTIRQVRLLGIPVSKKKADQDLRLQNDQLPNYFITQSGLIAKDAEAPDHRSQYSSVRQNYSLPEGADTLEVRLDWQDAGRKVTKIFTFKRGDYEIDLKHEVQNTSGSDWVLSPYLRYWRAPYSEAEEPPFIQSFFGIGWYEEKKDEEGYRYTKIDFDDLEEEPLKVQQTGGWLAMQQHYFLAAVIPPAEQQHSYFAQPKPVANGIGKAQAYAAGYIGQQETVPAGGNHVFASRLFIGPMLQNRLEDIAPGFELAIDYGILTLLAEPLFWVLDKLHGFTNNWGFAIIILTLIIKLAFFKLSEHQYRAMARMRKFAPRIQSIKERYADDREGLQKAMMDLYKKEGFNPLGGCWPMLVQIPVFIALYWVLLQSVELRQADFALWLNDLSAPDPYYVLPIMFGISMWLQQKLSGTAMTMDPMQQRMMTIMPIALTGFFAFFPAGLVLYWLVSNIIGIAQQWYITNKLEKEEDKKK